MSVADTRGARRRMVLRYRQGHIRTVSESIEAERLKAARYVAGKPKKR